MCKMGKRWRHSATFLKVKNARPYQVDEYGQIWIVHDPRFSIRLGDLELNHTETG